ncbi:hypothetical protein SARI_01601 [Salmonella enterica subsp. arizonae serovar 62:z4,z23:-]|uniref:Uncharacterized protein n=1 Tax=Salmonella arizonae (strain ATCC BAA-731 / CDC346-86 / RSK2980) TaxID=41514 RepID=A9MEN7_SALAR|nr:hypothetical protein SARI_01601 [Salmonella enterica subsp. arizonae serovar 62:z4,z23:-]
MGKNTPLGFHPEIEPTQVHDKKSEKRAKVHQRGDGFNLAQITEQQGDSAGKLMPDRVKTRLLLRSRARYFLRAD